MPPWSMEMPVKEPNPALWASALTVVAILTPQSAVLAASFDFRVSYVEVPGSDEIRAGQHDLAIEILERRLREADNPYRADELTTLCALYVVTGRFDEAAETCDAAVETAQSFAAYNNRGVLRAHLKDPSGALADFDRARVPSDDRCRYVDELTQSNARLIASRNYDVAIDYLQALEADPSAGSAMAGTSAEIEDLSKAGGPDFR